MNRTLAAFTDVTQQAPQYINASEDEHGRVIVTVRSPAGLPVQSHDTHVQGYTAAATLDRDKAIRFFTEALMALNAVVGG